MKITESSLKRNKYSRIVKESNTHNEMYICTWTKVIEDENGRKFTIEITEYAMGMLEEFGFPKHTFEGSFFRNDYKEHFTVSYIGSKDTTVRNVEKFYDEIWLKMSCQYEYED